MMILITYDVDTTTPDGAKRLRKVAKECVNYGHRVQKSVFECIVTEVQYKLLYDKIRKIIHSEKDSIRFYFMGKTGNDILLRWGKTTLSMCVLL